MRRCSTSWPPASASGIIDADGALDRAALAAIVFDDRSALADLNAIVHPAVRAEIAGRIARRGRHRRRGRARHPAADRSAHATAWTALVVVDAPVEVAVERLVAQRGMSEADARARIDKQISRETSASPSPTVVIDNGGDRESLVRQVDEAWRWMRSLPPVVLDPG